MADKKQAIWLQLFLSRHYGIDVSWYDRVDINDMAQKLHAFLCTGVNTEELQPVHEYSLEQKNQVGFVP